MSNKKIDSNKIDEFELVNNKEGKEIFKIDVINVEPTLNKTGTKFEFVLYDNSNSKIGIKDMDGKLTIFPEYKAKMMQNGINLNSKKIVLKGKDLERIKAVQEKEKERLEELKKKQEELHMQKEVENEETDKQEERENIAQNDNKSNQNKKLDEEKNKDKSKKKNEQENIKSYSSKITINDLKKNPKYKNVTALTTITDNEFLDSVQGIKAHSPQLDKNNIMIAEVNNEFKILAKEMGTNKIVDLTQNSRQIDNSVEQVNRIEGNKQTEVGRSVTFVNPAFDNKEIAIRKTSTGQIEVERIEDIDGKGNRETIKVATDITHPTEQEKKRAEYEKYGYNFSENSQDAIMTEDEIEEVIEPMIMEKSTKSKDENEIDDIKSEIMNDINSSENPTYDNLDEIVNENVERYEETEEEIEQEDIVHDEEEEEKTLENDALNRINRRK